MKKGKKKKNGFSGYIDKYNDLESKGNIQNTLLKGLIDLAGVAVGTGLGALAGKNSLFVGIGALLSGHFIGDKTNILRTIGASTVAYGVGKAKEYNSSPEMKTPNGRFSDLKGNLLATLYIKMETEKAETKQNESESKIENIPDIQNKEAIVSTIIKNKEEESEFSGIDFSELGEIEEQISQSAKSYEEKKTLLNNNESNSYQNGEFDDPDFSLM